MIEADIERGVFIGKFCQCLPKFTLVLMGFRGDHQFDHRWWNVDRLKKQYVGRITECVSGLGNLHSYECNDIACTGFPNLFPVLGVDPEDPSDPFILFFRGVEYLHTTFQMPGKDPDEGLLSDVWIIDQLKGQGRERFVYTRVPCVGFFLIIYVHAYNSSHIHRRRHIINYCIQ